MERGDVQGGCILKIPPGNLIWSIRTNNRAVDIQFDSRLCRREDEEMSERADRSTSLCETERKSSKGSSVLSALAVGWTHPLASHVWPRPRGLQLVTKRIDGVRISRFRLNRVPQAVLHTG